MPKLIYENKNITLLIVGDGPYRKDLEKLAQNLNISDKVIFTGRVPWSETGLYYQLADLFVNASESETQGLTIAESMVAGTPVLVKNDDNVRGIIKNGKNGLLFNTPEDFIDIVLKTLSNDIILKSIGEEGLNTANTLSAETFAEKVESLYLSCLSAKKIRRLKAYGLKLRAYSKQIYEKNLRKEKIP